MKLKFLALALVAGFSVTVHAQSVDEIIDKYIENTGGKANWQALQGIKMTATVKFSGLELPLTVIQLKDGRQSSAAVFQGMEFRQEVFDGSTLWGTNQMSMKPEKSDAETTENFKVNLGDFPSPFLDYKAKGYKVELLGKETVEGSETFKVKLTKKPIKVDGVETENVSFYYFDTENYVPLVVESEVKSGPGKGMVQQIKMSDYQEVNGLMFAFSNTVGAKGQPGGQNLVVTAIELNPKVDDALFAFPAGN
jgi:hypothetical protein